MRAPCAVILGIAFAALLVPSVSAHQVALKDGRVIQFEKYRVADGSLVYTGSDGKEAKIALADIDLTRTRQLSAADVPPLDLPGLAAHKQPSTSNETPSLGEVARKLRPKDSILTNKRIFTDDDVRHSSGYFPDEMPQKDYSQVELLNSTCEELAKAVLRAKDPKLDIDFPERFHWERDLCEARKNWATQYGRYEAHKGTSTEVQERELAADRFSYLKSMAEFGIAYARLYLEKQGWK